MLLSTVNLIYLLSFSPYISRSRNFIEIINETCVLFCAHSSVLLLNDALESKVKNGLGWTMVTVAILSIFFNISCAIYFAVFEAYKTYQANKLN